jgi:hypothetical protein
LSCIQNGGSTVYQCVDSLTDSLTYISGLQVLYSGAITIGRYWSLQFQLKGRGSEIKCNDDAMSKAENQRMEIVMCIEAVSDILE